MADVLLSLKHAVVHPSSPTGGYYSSSVAPNCHGYSSPHQDYGQQSYNIPAAQTIGGHYAQVPPAMSVNVSMNMTMNMNMHSGQVIFTISFILII